MTSAIAYYRVSTARQGKSGLGIEAQKAAVQRFAEAEGIDLIGQHVEVETGKGADAFDRRPEAAQRKCFDRSITDRHHVIDHHRLEKALGAEVVHKVVGIEGRLVTARALAFAKENLLAAEFGLSRLGGIEFAKDVELRVSETTA